MARMTDTVQMQKRIAEVADLVVAGLTTGEIHKYIREKRPEWKIERRQRCVIIARARETIKEAGNTEFLEELGKAIRRLNVLYRRSFTINDYKACAAIVKQLTDLLGLAAPAKVHHSGSIEVKDARQRLEDELAAVIAEAERATQG